MATEVAGRSRRWMEALTVLAMALAVAGRYAFIDNPLFWDEYYHLLAARSWAVDGTLAIADGVYTRAPWFTVAVGWVFRIFGTSIVAAKLFSAVVGSTWVLAVFLWTRSVAGRQAAWIASLLLMFSPLVLHVTGMVRFYGAQALFFWLGATALYGSAVGKRSPGGRAALWIVAVLCLSAALSLTRLTAVGVAALLAWWAGVGVVRFAKTAGRRGAIAAVVVLVAATALFSSTEYADRLIELGTWTPGWTADRVDILQWYHWRLTWLYPILWRLLPLAVLVAARRHLGPAWFCALIFVTVFGVHSIAAAKAKRYLAYAMPFFFVLWGLALAALLPGLRRLIADLVAGLSMPRRWLEPLAEWALLAMLCAYFILTSAAFPGMREVLAHRGGSRGLTPSEWDRAADSIRSLSAGASVVVTPNSLQTLYHVGRYDVALRGTVIDELRPPQEFGTDARTGRPAISTRASMLTLMSRHPTGLVFSERWRWRHSFEGVTDDVADLLESTAEEIPMPEEWRLVAYRWGAPSS